MWQSADLGPYLRLQLRSHSFLHQHLICHHCQSEQIRVSAAESERPPSSPCPWQPVCLLVRHQHSHLDSPSSGRIIGNKEKWHEFASSWLKTKVGLNTLTMCPHRPVLTSGSQLLSKRVNKYYIITNSALINEITPWDNSKFHWHIKQSGLPLYNKCRMKVGLSSHLVLTIWILLISCIVLNSILTMCELLMIDDIFQISFLTKNYVEKEANVVANNVWGSKWGGANKGDHLQSKSDQNAPIPYSGSFIEHRT